MKDTILKVENVSKQYRLGLVGTGTLSHDLNRWWHRIRGKEDPYLKVGEVNDRATKAASQYVWALKDINFEVEKGEVLGIIGKNGAGKSTLLKILSRVTGPTTGHIRSKGRIASLLEVGTGFHPELTGKENIYLNGTILGMTKAEIDSKLDEIIDFSGCERYIDTPTKRYSSGMTVRLAFAVAAHLEPEILIVDEVLAVGDAEFQKKAVGKMQDISKGEGRTVLFVSHNMAAVKSLCNRGILLENGSIAFEGEISDTVAAYLRSSNTNVVNARDLTNLKRAHGSSSVLKRFEFLSDSDAIASDSSLSFRVYFDTDKVSKLNLGYLIRDEFGNSILAANTKQYHKEITVDGQKDYLDVELERLPLVPGSYSMSLYLGDKGYDIDIIKDAIEFHVDWNKDYDFKIPLTKWGPTFAKTKWTY